MTNSCDVIVVGGGVMGLSISLELVRAGAGRILLLEKSHLGAGSSGKSGAILRQHYSHAITIKMARESLKVYSSFEEKTGRDIGFRRTGMVFLTHEHDRPALEKNVGLQKELGVKVDVLDRTSLAELEPRGYFEDEVVGAWEPEAGFVDPVKTVFALAAEATIRGAEIRVGEGVASIDIKGDSVAGVTTTRGEKIHVDTVVNAAGPWATGLMLPLGIDLPLKAIRPEQAYFEPPPDSGPETPVYGDLLTGLYWKPEVGRRTRVGKMSYQGDSEVPDPDEYDEGVSREFIDGCRTGIARRLPFYRSAVSWGGCGALYTITPDAHPLIGFVSGIDGLLLVSGFSGHGFKMGPAVGKAVTQLVLKDTSTKFDFEFFAVERFERGEGITAAYQYGILG